DELAGLGPRRREAHAEDRGVETTLEEDEEGLAHHTLLLGRAVEGAAELALEQAVDALDLLLLAHLEAVALGLGLGVAAVLAGRIVALFNGRLAGRVAAAFEEEVDPFAAGEFPGGSNVLSHVCVLALDFSGN